MADVFESTMRIRIDDRDVYVASVFDSSPEHQIPNLVNFERGDQERLNALLGSDDSVLVLESTAFPERLFGASLVAV